MLTAQCVACLHPLKNILTGEAECDWNMPGIPKPSSSTPLFLCNKTRYQTRCWSIFRSNGHESSSSPLMLSFLVCINVLQLVQLRVQDGDVCLSLQQRRPQLLIFLWGDSMSNIDMTGLPQAILSKVTCLWEVVDLSVQSVHILLWLSQFRVLVALEKRHLHLRCRWSNDIFRFQ